MKHYTVVFVTAESCRDIGEASTTVVVFQRGHFPRSGSLEAARLTPAGRKSFESGVDNGDDRKISAISWLAVRRRKMLGDFGKTCANWYSVYGFIAHGFEVKSPPPPYVLWGGWYRIASRALRFLVVGVREAVPRRLPEPIELEEGSASEGATAEWEGGQK